MNLIEQEMLDLLKKMHEENDVFAIKAEFEAEGSRMDELVMLNEVIFRANMKLIVKIGGCEAVSDIDRCKMLGAYGVMAPMIETPFAMRKFIAAGKRVYKDQTKDIEWIINAETESCYQNLDAILEAGRGFIRTVTVGRDDLSSSLNIPKSELNGEKMAEITKDILDRSKKAGYIANFGGGISTFDAIPFILQMYTHNDRVETRKVVFNAQSDEKRLKESIANAIEFEMLYLKNKCQYYSGMANEDTARLKMMEDRLENAKGQLKDG